ncbi:MAG: heparinase II/III family protein, partial [Syntrophothermus sp.]
GEPLLADIWLPDTKIMAAREKKDSNEGFYIAAVGSHNGKSHNHNDTGNFILYADGEPVIIDAGLGTYTAKTFSAERYTLWTMQSGYHNLPSVNGTMQKDGKEYAAKNHVFSSGKDSVLFSLDIAGAYPKETGLTKWIRTLKLSRIMSTLEVAEDYSSETAPKELSLSFMTPCSIDESKGGCLILHYGKGSESRSKQVILSYDPGIMTPEIQKIAVDDKRLSNIWGNELKRILFHIRKPESEGSLKVIFSRGNI